MVRVIVSATPAHPVLFGANVTFQVVVSRPLTGPPPVSIGGIIIARNPVPVVVSSSQLAVPSDAAGQATLQPSTGGAQGAILIHGTAAAGTSVLPFRLQPLSPVVLAGSAATLSPTQNGSAETGSEKGPENGLKGSRPRSARTPARPLTIPVRLGKVGPQS
jgi:hypothetical protein